ncbi:MAG: 4Fe-4S binding protein [Succinivibrionaceae bacterium]|nr:4Fe-4S binding protein [Succinivibrionaceae bacterium]
MSIRIDRSRCSGCGACVRVCPGNLLKLETESSGEKKCAVRDCRDCWGCCSCLKECRSQAIGFFLGADMGGRGAVMTVERHQSISRWKVVRPDGTMEVIETDARSANRY